MPPRTPADPRRNWRVRHSGDLLRLQAMEREARPFLTLRDDQDLQRLVALPADEDRITLGRDRGCTVPLDWDPAVSRIHAEMLRVGSAWTLVDDGLSRNGTQVNGVRISSRVKLRDGDLIRVGAVDIEFRDPRPTPATVTVVTDTAPVTLTAVQRRVLVALARPYAAGRASAMPASNQQIAAELVVSIDAVKANLRTLFTKFAITDLPPFEKRIRLVERALDQGVISEREL